MWLRFGEKLVNTSSIMYLEYNENDHELNYTLVGVPRTFREEVSPDRWQMFTSALTLEVPMQVMVMR